MKSEMMRVDRAGTDDDESWTFYGEHVEDWRESFLAHPDLGPMVVAGDIVITLAPGRGVVVRVRTRRLVAAFRRWVNSTMS